MGIWFGPGVGGGGGKRPLKETDFAYTGTKRFTTNGNNWEIALLTEGTLTFYKNINADIFLVAGGQPGKKDDSPGYGAGGDGGGYDTQNNVTLDKNTAYTVQIGGSGESTTFGNWNVISGAGSSGGAGISSGNSVPGNPGSPGVSPFGDGNSLFYPAEKFGAGGGSGARNYWMTSENKWSTQPGGAGGETGGGAGGGKPEKTFLAGEDGSSNTGGGGGGGGHTNDGSKDTAPGDGGSGIVLIRNHRS